MGNVLIGAILYLKNPQLVRTLQEACGVREISLPSVQNAANTSTQDSVTSTSDPESLKSSRQHGHSRQSSEDSTTSHHQNEDRSRLRDVSGASDKGASLQEWLASKVKVRRRLRRSPSPTLPPLSKTVDFSSLYPRSDSPEPETEEVMIIEVHQFLDIFFRIATEFGYEPFYITFLPFLFWNVDSLILRHVVILWCVSMYVGQAIKELVKWKRPLAPPVVRLVQSPKIEAEYGFPSTHATVSTTIPFYILYSCFWRYEFPIWLGVSVAVFWCFTVSFSRLYLGVHSVLDILAGMVIGLVFMVIIILCGDAFDHFIFNNQYCPLVVLATAIFLLYIYPVDPDPNKWSVDRADTGAILGCGIGIVTGYNIHGPFPDDINPGPFVMALPTFQVITMSIIRFVVGILLLLPTRFIMKLLCYKLLPVIMPTHGVKDVVKRPLVELPYKIITYSAIGFNCIYLSAIVFEICGISRWEGVQ